MAKAKIYMYGIEITKPHSKEMYTHNNKVAGPLWKVSWDFAPERLRKYINDFRNEMKEYESINCQT